MTKLSCMTDLWLFEQLTGPERRDIEGMTRRLVFRKGENLFLEGDTADAIFLVTYGRVKLYKVSEEGREIVLGYLTAHDMFGEEILFSDSRRAFSAQATEPTRACACYKADFEGLIAQNSAISKKVIQALGRKLNSMAEHLADVAIYDTRRRVARTLARLAKDYGDPTDEGRRLNFRLTHEELGALVGASRVMVTNVLKSLGDEGSVYSDERAHRFVVSRELLAVAEAEAPEEVPPPPEPPCACYREPF